MIDVQRFDEMKEGQSCRGIGYHWTDPNVSLEKELRDGTFYVSDDLFEWSSPWLEGMTAYRVEYEVHKPHILRMAKEIYEYSERKLIANNPTADSFVYIPHGSLCDYSHRQMLLLDPKRQVKRVTLVTPKDMVFVEKIQSVAPADHFDNYLPIIANSRLHNEDSKLAAEGLDVFAIDRSGVLCKMHISEILSENESINSYLDKAAGHLDILADRFRHQANGGTVPEMNVSQGLLKPLGKGNVTRINPPDSIRADNDIDSDRLLRHSVAMSNQAYSTLENIRGEQSLGYSNWANHLEERGHPSQDVSISEDGVWRFKENAIVKYLVDNGPWDLNYLRQLGTDADYSQLAQQIGYSVSGWGSLSMVNSAAWTEAELAVKIGKQKLTADLDLQTTKIREVPPVPGVKHRVTTEGVSTFVIPWEWATILASARRDDVRMVISVDDEGIDLELTSNVGVFEAEGSTNYTVMQGESGLTISNEGMVIFSVNDTAILEIKVDKEILGKRLSMYRSNNNEPGTMTLGLSMMFNNGLLEDRALFRPEWLYLMLESVWRFMSIRKRMLAMWSSNTLTLAPEITASAHEWLTNGWGLDRPVTGALVEAITHRPKGHDKDSLFLLGMYNIYHSDVDLCNGEVIIHNDNLMYAAKISNLEEHL